MMDIDREEVENQILLNKRKAIKEQSERIYKENSKRRLLQVLDKKFQTTMIGALARFEEAFGELWGHKDKEITEEQMEFRRIWEQVRTDILNNGNNQRRAAQEEIANYTMSWDKFKTELVVKQKG